ncbi:hypothetical protein TWF569_000727 [Orbilia oligospora]|uniref:Hemerythrin-like domain-containing protein n=1 Tax=Orbilia oligospora TaxID=2813651 RepID=A0A7C8JT31_ORBOL|nr:hypothetical protein TWF103_001894 [Orbilia oligospora]KAF3097796.1 hypothetical protein TWF102_006302 [Orbilia oligospora]KAF3104110.1 hypothetical protein TWF706_004582 [Orbilia oligospora]KAF3123976.1 hypothetical protein TWF703_000552 [Orbilia oligospora]KAF3125824.1 hypothetical protein TWF569_000727 [Orbilia oligospora]
MAASKEQVLEYNDLNADKFPEPVETIKIDKYNLSAATVDMKDPVVALLVGLFTIHSLIRRGLRAVARQARNIEPTKRAAFLEYAKMTFETLDGHHHHEEEIFFPIMKPYVDFTESSHEHEEIERLLHQNLEYVKTAETHLKGGEGSPAWPGEEISSTTERLIEVLLPHLQKEETLSCLYARRVPPTVLEECNNKIEKAVFEELKKQGMIWGTSYQLRHFNKKEKEIFPPMPTLVRLGFEFFGWLGYGKVLQFGPTEEELKN